MPIDVNALINTTVSEKLDDQFEATPAGEYIATIGDRSPIDSWFRTVNMSDGRQMPQCNIPFVINDPEVAKALGRREATTRLTLWLDTVADTGRLDTGHGKNVGLGALRKALGQENDTSWNFNKLVGAGPIKVLTEVQESKQGAKFSNVVRVGRIGDKLAK